MGIFRKKQNESKETSYRGEETSKKSLSKWVCGSKASKEALREDNKITEKNSSYSTSSSSHDSKEIHKMSSEERMLRELENSIIASLPPPAAESAFEGRPRFDWIDVEYHAATRIQTIFRRHIVLKEMERAGLTTSYIRNRKRQRKAKFFQVDSAAPDLGFGCCGVLNFGNDDFDAADNIAFLEYQRKRYEAKTRAQKEREEFLSKSYLEQKGIRSKLKDLEETKFRDGRIMGR